MGRWLSPLSKSPSGPTLAFAELSPGGLLSSGALCVHADMDVKRPRVRPCDDLSGHRHAEPVTP